MEDYELVGGATFISSVIPKRRVVVTFTKGSGALFNDKLITFNPVTLILKFPTIDNKKTFSVRNCNFNFATSLVDHEELEGKYHIYRIDEDNYKLEKI